MDASEQIWVKQRNKAVHQFNSKELNSQAVGKERECKRGGTSPSLFSHRMTNLMPISSLGGNR